MRIATYHRVSTRDQHEHTAREELRAAAERLGGDLVLEIEETGSGASNDRPGLLELLAAAKAGNLDVVLVWALDRLGRSTIDLLGNVRTLQTSGVRLVATHQGIDLRPGRDPTTQLTITIMSAVAEYERAMIADRTRAGLARARREGRRLGRPRTRPPGAEVVDLRRQGLTWREVAAELDCTVAGARRAAAEMGADATAHEQPERPV